MKEKRIGSHIAQAAVIIGPAIGLAQAYAAALAHIVGLSPRCRGGGCDEVAFHPLAYLFGVPIAFFGVAFYVALLAAGFASTRDVRYRTWGVALSVVGVVVSGVLLYTLRYRIETSCERCALSAFAAGGTALGYMVLMGSPHLTSYRRLSPGVLALSLAGLLFSGWTGTAEAKTRVEEMKHTTPLQLSGGDLKTLTTQGAVYGTAKGPTVAIFIDFLCSGCHDAVKKLRGRIDAGEGFQLRAFNYPLRNDGPARVLAHDAAGRDDARFWQVFAQTDGKKVRSVKDLENLRALIGPLQSLAEKQASEARIDRERALGDRCGVTSTPHIVIIENGKARSAFEVPYKPHG